MYAIRSYYDKKCFLKLIESCPKSSNNVIGMLGKRLSDAGFGKEKEAV